MRGVHAWTIALTLVGLLVGPEIWAQTKAVLKLGESNEEVVRDFASPARYRMGHYYYSKVPVIATGDPLFDVYKRQTAQNEYEIWIRYKIDASSSRLHPTLRVEEIRFLLDKARPMKQVMEDLPEVGFACLPGCHILVDAMFGYSVWLVTQLGGDGTLVSGNIEDPATGNLQRLSTPDLTISRITVESGTSPSAPLAHDTGSVWRPTVR